MLAQRILPETLTRLACRSVFYRRIAALPDQSVIGRRKRIYGQRGPKNIGGKATPRSL
jgi:hypothetical protein